MKNFVLKKIPIILILSFVFTSIFSLFCLNVSAHTGYSGYVWVSSSSADRFVYVRPDSTSMQIGSAWTEWVTVFWKEGSYYYIEYNVSAYGGKKRGYIKETSMNNLASGIPQSNTYPSWNATCGSGTYTIYNCPNTSSYNVGSVWGNESITVLDEDEGSGTQWYYVQYTISGGFKRGYIQKYNANGDDYSNLATYATNINVGSNLNGSINYSNDQDWFKFTPSITADYDIYTGGSTDTYGYLYNSSLSEITSNDDGNGYPNFKISQNLTAYQTYYIKVRGYGSYTTGAYTFYIGYKDINEPFNNASSGATSVSLGSTISDQKITSTSDVDWYQISVPSSVSYRMRVILWNPTSDTSSDKAHLKLEVYSGSSANILEGAALSEYDDNDVTVRRDNYSGNKVFYIKVLTKDGDYSYKNNYQIMFSTTDQTYGGEIYGWDYTGNKKTPTVNYRMDTGMNSSFTTSDGIQTTYKDLFQEAISRWNALNLKGDGTPMFGIDYNIFSPFAKALSLPESTNAQNNSVYKDITLNTNNFPNMVRNEAIAIIAHELGHTLGLDDLYINSSYGYYFYKDALHPNELLDNSSHLMYGIGNNTFNLPSIFHSEDIFGTKKIQNYLSLKAYTVDDLYQSADFIIKGKVVNHAIYENDEEYSKITFNVGEVLFKSNKTIDNQIEFLQRGTVDNEFFIDPIFKTDEEYILFLKFDLYGELFVVGGPQGRFEISNENGILKINNQVDKYVQNVMFEKKNIKKDFSKNLLDFLNDAKIKIKNKAK